MNPKFSLAKLYQWIFRTEDLRRARAEVDGVPESRQRAARQASLLVEVARLVDEPVEPLPAGSRPALAVGLCRDAVYWALVAAGSGEAAVSVPPGRPDLASLWTSYPEDELARIAGGAETAEAIRAQLVGADTVTAMAASEEDATRARSFAKGLVASLDAPRQRMNRILAQRWTRVILGAVALVLLLSGIRSVALGPNLVADKPPRTSSNWPGCATDPGCAGLLFCTNPEMNPWVEFDLGSAKRIHRIDVTNRGDCCGERAVPLIVETSSDRVSWTEVARRDKEFSSWTAKFAPRQARYVKFKVPRDTVFHLQEVAIR